MRDLLAAHVTALSHQHGSDIFAFASGAVELGDKVHGENALLAAKLAGDPLEIDVLIKAAVETIGMDAQPGIDDRADRSMSCGIEFLGQP